MNEARIVFGLRLHRREDEWKDLFCSHLNLFWLCQFAGDSPILPG